MSASRLEMEMKPNLADAVHDLRNQIAAVRAEAQLALLRYERNKDPEFLKKALESVLQQSDEVVDLIQQRLH